MNRNDIMRATGKKRSYLRREWARRLRDGWVRSIYRMALVPAGSEPLEGIQQ